MAVEGSLRPGGQAAQLALNMNLLAHNELAGFGGVGEGISLQKAKDGRRILWLAQPAGFDLFDVSKPEQPKLISHFDASEPCSFRSETLIYAACFNGGLRAYDLTNALQPREVAYFVPGTPKLSPKGLAQINDVWVDENRIVYAVDRFTAGSTLWSPRSRTYLENAANQKFNRHD